VDDPFATEKDIEHWERIQAEMKVRAMNEANKNTGE
jgi:hypothetical protein